MNVVYLITFIHRYINSVYIYDFTRLQKLIKRGKRKFSRKLSCLLEHCKRFFNTSLLLANRKIVGVIEKNVTTRAEYQKIINTF